MATLESLKINAIHSGYTDATRAKLYRDSAPHGSMNRQFLKEYDEGWNKGRKEMLDRKTK